MTSFLEKLKKGMDIKKVPDIKEGLPEDLPPVQKAPKKETFPEPLSPKPVLAVATNTIKSKKAKSTKKKKETVKKPEKKSKVEKIEIKEEKPKRKEFSPVKSLGEKEGKEWFEPEGQLVVDVYQTDGEIVIQSAIAGVRPEDLDISIENDVVTIRGGREKSFESKGANYFYQECYWGRFSREIILPAEVDGKRAEATMKNGILTIKIPKIERGGRKKVAVKG